MERNNTKFPWCLYLWCIFGFFNLIIFLYWEIFVIVILMIQITETPSSMNDNKSTKMSPNSGILVTNIILSVGIICWVVYAFVNYYVNYYIGLHFREITFKVKEDICNQERQIVTLQRQLNQRPRLNFARLDNEVPLYREIGQTQN